MRNLVKYSTYIAVFAITIHFSNANNNCLTEEQQLLFTANVKQSVENFEEFRSTLDVFQLAILHTPNLKEGERTRAFFSALSLEQKALWEAHRVLEQSMIEDLKSRLSSDQRENIDYLIESSLDREVRALLEANKVLREALDDDLIESDSKFPS